MNVVFMGTPDFAVPTLESLVKNGHNISLVITQPDKKSGRGKKLTSPPVKDKALELGLEVFQPKNVNNSESIEFLKRKNPDVIIVVAYGQILKESILHIPKYGCINVHASLLPKYRGAAPINWAIINGENISGVTIMYMDKGLDTGDMILKKEIPINEKDTAGDLHDKLMYVGADALIEALEQIKNGTFIRESQNHELSTYASMMDKTLGLINWNKNGKDIVNLIKGVNPWPGAYLDYKGNKIKVFETEIINRFENYENGEIIKVNDEGIFINANDKCIIVKEIQFPGKRKMKVHEFLKGNELEEGIVL